MMSPLGSSSNIVQVFAQLLQDIVAVLSTHGALEDMRFVLDAPPPIAETEVHPPMLVEEDSKAGTLGYLVVCLLAHRMTRVWHHLFSWPFRSFAFLDAELAVGALRDLQVDVEAHRVLAGKEGRCFANLARTSVMEHLAVKQVIAVLQRS